MHLQVPCLVEVLAQPAAHLGRQHLLVEEAVEVVHPAREVVTLGVHVGDDPAEGRDHLHGGGTPL